MNAAPYQRYTTILAERTGRILTLTMNRPEQLNAADAVMHNELSRVFHDVAHDDETDVVILTGAGAAFSSGGDIVGMQRKIADRSLWVATVEEARRLFYGMIDLPKPVIAKVRGPATGLGATLVVYADVSFAADTARIGDPHVKVGLAAGDGGALMWPMLCGVQRAKELLFTGDILDAAEAQRAGLFTHVVAEAELDARVQEFAEKLARGALKAIGYTKLAINQTVKQLAGSTFEFGVGLETLSQLTKDHEEAVAAFAEKRRPRFTGA